MFDIVPPSAIREGRATDAYFDRTLTTLADADVDPHVVAEVTADQFPTGEFELFAGVEDAAELLAERSIDVDALREGQLFDGGPVMRIEGRYTEFARLETTLLGFISHASGIATNALHARRVAPDSQLLSFGARHVHPSMAAVVERAALVAGFDGFSHVAAGELLGREASGTMPHALVLCFGTGEQETAWNAFDAAVSEDVPRIALCDTFSDETDEVLRAAETIDLDGVRIDTPSSRRGDFRHIAREVRWRLDAEGFEDIDVFLSGGLGPADLRELRDVADGFGVGGYVSNADPVDFALDIIEIDGEPIAKRGKLSGRKDVYRTEEGAHRVRPASESSSDESLLKPLVRDGEIVREFDIDAAAERALADAERVGFGTDD
ncbi:nicotinate phosphoribosyltransferase [Halocatena salina]|uniref:Nicotinate phosphoribosyltransferase n=1 Tax=Halocatena salina TaxID=2934340 RepID=A0A8U0A0R8_9EURY|nr:nicotinate phosphoribosyltransferase [Halocatena salina]UPM42389.1 nicotinate phosphoribosyltransferase [Halocatena salina]